MEIIYTSDATAALVGFLHSITANFPVILVVAGAIGGLSFVMAMIDSKGESNYVNERLKRSRRL